MSDLKPDRQRRDLHKSNLPVTSRKIGPVYIISAMGVIPFLKTLLMNWPDFCHRFLEESLAVPVVLHVHSHWFVLQLLTLPGLLSWLP
jgi:hypothetical protein